MIFQMRFRRKIDAKFTLRAILKPQTEAERGFVMNSQGLMAL